VRAVGKSTPPGLLPLVGDRQGATNLYFVFAAPDAPDLSVLEGPLKALFTDRATETKVLGGVLFFGLFRKEPPPLDSCFRLGTLCF